MKTYNNWLQNVKDSHLKNELLSMTESQIKESFYKNLEFGTGGQRGVIGAGTNKINIYTVAKTSKGVADYINSIKKGGSVAIAYDSRNMSLEFSQTAAKVFSANGIKVYIFDKIMPTPILSFAVRQLKTTMGIVITASHNPAEYNGYKVYNSDGCQITDSAAKQITTFIDKVENVFEIEQKNDFEYISNEIYERYLQVILSYSQLKCGDKQQLKVAYSPLNGAGLIPVTDILKRVGIQVFTVKEQREPDGNFATCKYPNPEDKKALQKAITLAKKQKTQIVLATDPDADRVGVAERQKNGHYRLFSGNEIGILLLDYILKERHKANTMPQNPTLIKTIVSSDMCYPIAEKYNVNIIEVLTGFKYIGEQISLMQNSKNFLLGYEESYGYLIGDFCRDKDAVSASMLICEMTATYLRQDMSLTKILNGLYKKHGYYYNQLKTYEFKGADGANKIKEKVDILREKPLKQIGKYEINNIIDYKDGINGLPKSNIISFIGNNFKVIIRPSGTESKLKIYFLVKEKKLAAAKHTLKQLGKGMTKLLR